MTVATGVGDTWRNKIRVNFAAPLIGLRHPGKHATGQCTVLSSGVIEIV